MENSQMKTLKPSQNPPFPFPPHRRRPLQSETYRVFVQIMSHCNALQALPQHKKQGEAAEENKLVEVNRLGEAAEHNKFLDHDPTETESLLLQQKSAANATKEATGVQDRKSTSEPVEGDLFDPMDIVTDSSNDNHVNSFMENNQTIDSIVDLIIGQEDGCNAADMTEVSLTRQEKGDKQAFLGEVAEAIDSSLEMDMVAEFSRPTEDVRNSTGEKTLPEGIEHQLQLKEKELEELISTSSAMNSSVCLIADDDIEEGEISGDIEVYDEAMHFLFDDAVSLEEKKVEEVQIHKETIDKEEINCDGGESGLGKYGRSISASLNTGDNGKAIMKLERQSTRSDLDVYAGHLAERDIEIKEADGQDIFLKSGQNMDQATGVQGADNQAALLKDLASHGQAISDGTTENKDLVNNRKDNTVEKKKRKKGPLSKESKAKKKQKERIKRAEKNRKLGVKRLKLQPIVKQKKVTYCRHYLKGRCQEGEKCKFSHDTTPLTKSQPCCHFARHSCMKGDNCPFDHQLSKYPCNNYVSKAFCSRGADCLFSHAIADKEGSLMTSNVPKPEFKSLFQTGDPNSKKQVKIDSNPPQDSSGKSSEKKVAQHLQKPPAQIPKGISVFSPLGLSPGHKSKHEKSAQPLKGENGVNTDHKMLNSSLGSGQKSNDLTKRVPMRTPKGINFLSFGKAPLLDSGSNTVHGIGKSLLSELNESTSFGLPPKNDGGAKTENQSGQSPLESESNKHKTANMISPASRPQGITFLAFGENPQDNTSAAGHAGLLPRNVYSGSPLVQARENVLDGLKFSTEVPCRLASSSNPFCQSSHQSGPRNEVGMSNSQNISLLSNKPSSVQKALQSTLAFAAKFDSHIKLGASTATKPAK